MAGTGSGGSGPIGVGATTGDPAVHPGTRIGHVHLRVADLERAIGFYHGVLGFEVTQRWGDHAAFLSAGGYHHHLGLNTWQSRGGSPPAPGTTGLYHLAILYPTRRELADALRRLIAAGIRLDGASDHGVSEALYLRDPDGNGVELYADRDPADWLRDAEGGLVMGSEPIDLADLLAELDGPAPGRTSVSLVCQTPCRPARGRVAPTARDSVARLSR
ncbi:MAG: Glyoxalase family protein [uncultured Thermomicrobiales bacterium]|uniref:Glyoxalase family protein n=1 Tax=uncultured Thermomicrobiales bacterium TaxID=1645740 RepID=A0A6J4UAF3_9BACT|nr:MAG: Glyoxalase family protein [uncultured Thermomicrobiales bacterium]